MSSLPRTVSVALLLASVSAQAQWMPYAVDGPDGTSVWLVEEATQSATLVESDVTWLSLDIEGKDPAERLLRPHEVHADEQDLVPRVLLPNGGALLRYVSGSDTVLAHVRQDGQWQRVLTLPGGGTIESSVSVDADGTYAAVVGGGNTWLIDLQSSLATSVSRCDGSPVEADGESLRVGSSDLWFLVDGTVHHADVPGDCATPIPLPVTPGTEVDPELVLSDWGEHVVVLTGAQDDLRDLWLLGHAGSVQRVTPVPALVDSPTYDEDLGPFLDVSPDGSHVAYRTSQGDVSELHVANVSPASTVSSHITADPEFPAYVDNIGTISFVTPTVLCFFAGDLQLSVAGDVEVMGAADMYSLKVTSPGQYAVTNVTVTNGQVTPPFTSPGALSFSEAVLDPAHERFLVMGDDEDGQPALQSFVTTGWADATPQTILGTGFDPELTATGSDVFIFSESDEGTAGVPQIELLLLGALSGGGQLTSLGVLPPGFAISRAVSDPAGLQAACVASLGDFEIPLLVLSEPPIAAPLLWWFDGVSSEMAFSGSGRLHLGLGVGPVLPVMFDGFAGAKAGLPVGHAAPIGY